VNGSAEEKIILMEDFEGRIAVLDLRLFDYVPSQTTPADRRSLLAIQHGLRQQVAGFGYLEIGSHYGGSLQAFVADPCCDRIISIDPRPKVQADERGRPFSYPDNSTQRMLELLQGVPGAQVDKIKTIEAGTDALNKTDIAIPPDVCFVDGEHTDRAVVRDARFCFSVVHPDGCVAFHDANIIYRGLLTVVDELKQSGRPFHAYVLPDSVFVIELGNCRLHQVAEIQALLLDNHQGYLSSLAANDHYRELAKRPMIRWATSLEQQIRRLARWIPVGRSRF